MLKEFALQISKLMDFGWILEIRQFLTQRLEIKDVTFSCASGCLLVTLVPATNSFQERLFSIKRLALGDLQRRNQGSKVCISANTEQYSIQPWPFHLKCVTCQVYFTSQLICHLSICTGGRSPTHVLSLQEFSFVFFSL